MSARATATNPKTRRILMLEVSLMPLSAATYNSNLPSAHQSPSEKHATQAPRTVAAVGSDICIND